MYRVKITVMSEPQGLFASAARLVHAVELTDVDEHRALARADYHLVEFMGDAQARGLTTPRAKAGDARVKLAISLDCPCGHPIHDHSDGHGCNAPNTAEADGWCRCPNSNDEAAHATVHAIKETVERMVDRRRRIEEPAPCSTCQGRGAVPDPERGEIPCPGCCADNRPPQAG